MLKNNKSLIIILLLGFSIRIFLTLVPGLGYDVGSWFIWAKKLVEVGFARIYSINMFIDYTPGYLYILAMLGILKNIFQINDILFFIILKLPAILAETASAILIYKILREEKIHNVVIYVALFYLNPALIFNSAVWGQIDGFLTLFLLWAVYLLKRRQTALAAVMAALALLIKPQTLAILPVFLLRQTFVKLLVMLSAGLITVFLLSLPFFPNPFTELPKRIFATAGEYPYMSVNAYNVWGMIGFWQKDNNLYLGLTYQKIGLILLGSFWILLSTLYLKRKLSLYSLAALALLGFFFLLTRVHERYLYPAIPFLILAAAEYQSKILYSLTAVLSLTHFLNLYFVYIYYNQIQLQVETKIYYPAIYNFLQSNGQLLSMLSTILFLLISIIIIKLNYVKKTSD